MIYALDTNTISFIIRGNEVVREKYFQAASKGIHCVIPLMVYYEVKRGLKANNAGNRLRSFEGICTVLGITDLTAADMDIAAEIYAERKSLGKPIDDGDLLIAAQCINHGYVLVTNNTKHFQDVKALEIIDWTQ
ncbi:MAG: PIN domain-containing protein [Defluviitaleaceae bacterium]|nr:PIN domain-containing protein [Defluviitaleaceae bacterium]